MKTRTLSSYALLFASISAIIGSGWLFSAYYTSLLAGPASLLSWIIGGFAVIIVAFTFAELSAFVPVTGASIRVPRYTHGMVVGFIFAWILWLSYVALTAVEVQAMLQYCNFFINGLVHKNGAPTHLGYLVATGLMLLVTAINLYSLRWLIRCNNVFTLIKFMVPIVVAFSVLSVQLPHHAVYSYIQHETFMPYGFKGVLAAITSGGIIFAFNGFKQASEMAGEATDPNRALPLAIVGSVVICLLIFLCLQLAFLSTIHTDHELANWQSLKLMGVNSPFALILNQSHLTALLPVLYLGAILGPFAASLMYCNSAARSLYAMSQNGSLPLGLSYVTQQGIPVRAILLNFLLGMGMFAPFPGWNNMANFLTSLMALTYATAPLCVLTLRRHFGDEERFFKLPFAVFWNFAAFYICSLLLYWSGWGIVSKFYIALLIGFGMLMIYKLFSKTQLFTLADWKASVWVWPYFLGMTLISYFGSFDGKGVLPLGPDFIAIGCLSLITIMLATRFSYEGEVIREYIQKLKER